jgi:hypothetical protein
LLVRADAAKPERNRHLWQRKYAEPRYGDPLTSVYRTCEVGNVGAAVPEIADPPSANIEALELYIQKSFYFVLSGTFREATHRG